MLATKISPAIKQAIEFVCKKINNGTFQKGSNLPGIKELSRSSHLSSYSIWKALQRLKTLNILDGLNGRNFQIVTDKIDITALLTSPAFQPQQSRSSATLAWQRVKETIKSDILNNIYETGKSLPSYKELQSRYNISYRTIKKALDSLCIEKIVEPWGRFYKVRSTRAESAMGRVVFIVVSDRTGRLSLEYLNEEYLRILEMDCLNSQIRLDVYTYNLEDDAVEVTNIRDGSFLQDDDSTLGYFHILVSPADIGKREKILGKLSHYNKPLAILDVTGGWKMPAFLHRPTVRLFSAAVSPKPARLVARYLLEMGHKKICYISPFHRSIWSENRYFGLSETFSSAGYQDGVYLCAFNNPPIIHDFYHESVENKCDLSVFQKAYNSIKSDIPSYYRPPIEDALNFLLPWRILTQAELNNHCQTLYKDALENSDITAWVCANDNIAMSALTYLKSHNIDVPSKISIIGFDDSSLALRNGITSYNFNTRAMAHTMLDFVLNIRSLPLTRRPIELDGMVIERLTTAPRDN